MWHLRAKMKTRKYKTKQKNPDEFPQDLPVSTRRSVCLEDKYQVVQFYAALKKEISEHRQALCEPHEVDQMGQLVESSALKKSKKTPVKRNLQKECELKFPDIVKKNKVCRWHASCVRECWSEVPQTIRLKLKTLPNSWRNRMGLPLKGRSIGGNIPEQIRRELDYLLVESAMGASEISERKEPITAEQVVTKLIDSVFFCQHTNKAHDLGI